MRIAFTIVLLCATLTVSAQVKILVHGKTAIPRSLSYKGHVIDAIKFADKDGEHLVITTETGETPSKNGDGDDYRDAALYAYHYLIQSGTYKSTWTLYDFVKDCPVDIDANFVRQTLAVTDLDNNGIAEIWLMYKTACHGDVSPSDLKIIMHQGNKKYAMRGTNNVKVSESAYDGGKYTFDQAFKDAPASLKQYAQNLWKKNLLEKWD